MANWRYRRLLRQAWHPPDEELLLYVDGEADSRSARRLSDHLAGCWTCRARRDEIERAIGAYMAYHRDPARTAGASGGDDPEQTIRRFAAALARAGKRTPRDAAVPASASVLASAAGTGAAPESAAEGEWSPSFLGRSSWRMPALRRVAWTLARAAALLIVVVLAARWWLAPEAVSARELLARVDRAEQQEIAAVANPVVYQRLHASRSSTSRTSTSRSSTSGSSTDDTVTWEVWSSQRQRRIVERVSARSPLLHDLQTVLRENGMEPGQPLSAASLTAWRRFAGHLAEDVRETTLPDGAAAIALTLTAPGPVQEGRIARSEIIVRTRDWHPVGHILTVAGAAGQQQRYAITELHYRIVPFDTVDATVFNPPAVAAPLASDTPVPDAASASPSPAVHPVHAALGALYAEHTSGACLENGAMRDASSGSGRGAEMAMRHLWAIRHLAEWYRAADAGGLDRRSASLLSTMIREHVRAAHQLVPSSGDTAPLGERAPVGRAGPVGEAAPIDDAVPLEGSAAASGESWTTVAMKAYAAVEYASRAGALEGTSATDANSGGGDGRQDASARRDAAARARALLRSLDAAAQRLAPGAAPRAAPPVPSGVTPPHKRP